MKKITIPATVLHDPATDRIIRTKETTIVIEHSLVSLSKWESKWKIPFLNKEHTTEMFDDYIRCMTITQNIDQNVYYAITPEIRNEVREYMEDKMTAAVVKSDNDGRPATKFVTSDLIYAWMVMLRVPSKYEKWHLNRLLTLIQIVNIEQKPPKKANKAQNARDHHSINAARRAKRRR